jgi:RNA polymerase sigma-70 factor (ECF subfamily)
MRPGCLLTDKGQRVSAEIQRLVADCLAERPEAMGQLVSRFRGPVLGLCYRMLGQWQDAEDAAQETFLRVARSLSSWDSRRDFEPWLLAIAANRCRTLLARRQREPVAEPLREPVTARPFESTAASLQGLSEEIDRVLATLPADWSLALRLFHQEGLDYQQVAQRLGRPVGTVKTWVHRARLLMLDRLRRRGMLGG